ncbi:hypothetical protein [Vibrio metschnikovii]|uniref:hypothetical protein n=1 Tax=Vibrio metschnikovii TaxID=28172 RepID=UPI0030C6A6E4
MAFLLCVGFCGYGVMRKLGSSVVSPLSGRYVYQGITMSYVTEKDKNQILSEMIGTSQPGSSVHEQQKSAIIVRCTEDIQESISALSDEIDNLKMAFEESSRSSSKVALSLNWLTFALVLVGIAQIIVAFVK